MSGYSSGISSGASGAVGSSGSSSGSGSSSSSGGFPLRANFFRSLPLSKDTVESLYTAAKANATACLTQSFNEQWRYVPPEKDGTQLRKDTSNLATSCRYVRAATVLRCQEHEVNMVIANTNTDSWREFMRKCFGKHYIDTLILHSFSGPIATSATTTATTSTATSEATATASPDKDKDTDNNRAHRSASDRPLTGSDEEPRPTLWLHGNPLADKEMDNGVVGDADDSPTAPQRRHSDTQSVPSDDESPACPTVAAGEEPEELLTVKWGALDTGGQGKRDLCVVDYLSTATIPNTDSSVHMWCFSSVEGERVGCMALKDTHGITRTTSLAKLGVFWRRVGDEETEVIVCGSFASKHAKYVSAIFLQSLQRLQGIVEDLRLSNQIYIHRSTWVKDHERSSCHLCMRNFYALRRKHHCRKCGEVICSDCSVVENVDLPVIGSSKLRLCKVCCLKAKSTPLKRNDKSNVFDHLVRARSLSNMQTAVSSSSSLNGGIMSSPFNSNHHTRMSFADSGSGSGGSNGGRDLGNNYMHHHYQQQQQQAAAITAAAALRAEQLVESTSRSSSSFSSSNTNDFELTDSLDDYQQLQQQHHHHTHPHQQQQHQAAVHPMSKEMRGLSSATLAAATTTATSTSSIASSTPMLATQDNDHDDDDDFDDFIDARSLNKQLSAMEQRQKLKAATAAGNNGSTHGSRSVANSNMFDLLCELACQTLNCPIASVSILDARGDSIRSVSGLSDKPELDEELTLFLDKVMGSTPTIVLDANVDKQVTSLFTKRGGPVIRFFAGCPIYSRSGKKLGYVCVADVTKRDTLGPSCAFTMERLATLAVTTMERSLAGKQPGDRDYAGGGAGASAAGSPLPPPAPTPVTPYVTGSYGGNNQTSHVTHAYPVAVSNQNGQYAHPAAIFDRPVSNSAPVQPQVRHRQSSAQQYPYAQQQQQQQQQQQPPQYNSAAQAYQYQQQQQQYQECGFPPQSQPQPMHARMYDVAESDLDMPGMAGSPMAYNARSAPPPPPPTHQQQSSSSSSSSADTGAPPVAPLPRQYNEYSAGYYEAQERMRKLLIKSYHTQQQLATGSSPNGQAPLSSGGNNQHQQAYHAQY